MAMHVCASRLRTSRGATSPERANTLTIGVSNNRVDQHIESTRTVDHVPEGDTIRRLADKISRHFAGQRCERCVTRDPRLVGVDLAGATLVGADAVGKHLFIRFDNGFTLHSHLRMTGSWWVGPQAREPEWRRRIELWMESGRLTGVDLPVVEL